MEGREEDKGRKEGRKMKIKYIRRQAGRKKGGRMERQKEGRNIRKEHKEGRNIRKDGRKERRKEGRTKKDRRKEGRKAGRKEGRYMCVCVCMYVCIYIYKCTNMLSPASFPSFLPSFLSFLPLPLARSRALSQRHPPLGLEGLGLRKEGWRRKGRKKGEEGPRLYEVRRGITAIPVTIGGKP
jgi:hypothetical protein